MQPYNDGGRPSLGTRKSGAVHRFESLGGLVLPLVANESKLFTQPRLVVSHDSGRDDPAKWLEGGEQVLGSDSTVEILYEQVRWIDDDTARGDIVLRRRGRYGPGKGALNDRLGR
jgi:hypothetical protein